MVPFYLCRCRRPWAALLFLSSLVVDPQFRMTSGLSSSSSSFKSKRKLSTVSNPRFFIGGVHGYCGRRLAARLRQAFPKAHIAGTVRQVRPDAAADNVVNAVHVWDRTVGRLSDAGIADLTAATHLVQTIAPVAATTATENKQSNDNDDENSSDCWEQDRDIFFMEEEQESSYREILNQSKALQWVGYLSSTGVYGDHEGDWVEEESSSTPSSGSDTIAAIKNTDTILKCVDRKSLARVRAEADWGSLEIANGFRRVDCFRCGGIYGPGRGPLFAAGNAGFRPNGGKDPKNGSDKAEATLSPQPKYVNRILVDDLCGALLAAIQSTRPVTGGGRAYNLVDDDPAPRAEVVREAQRLLAQQSDEGGAGNDDSSNPHESRSPAPSRRRPTSRNTGNKRCRNDRLKREYGWTLQAPTFREGLAQLLPLLRNNDDDDNNKGQAGKLI